MTELFLGIDSTDSLQGGCTTHVATLLAEMIVRLGGEFLDYPHLVRLNPNIPWKTRGNGALSLHFNIDASQRDTLIKNAIDVVSSEADPASDPGLVVLEDGVGSELKAFATNCLHDVVPLEEAESLIKKFRIDAHRWRRGRGLIGALAAIGLELPPDYTFELIAYRHRQNLGRPRQVDPKSVRAMDEATKPYTLNNIDPQSGRILVTPRGPDPVLFGVRGESPEVLLRAFTLISIGEPVERWVIFRTNECTDSHLRSEQQIAQLKPYTPTIVAGTVIGEPRITRGGHVFADIEDETGRLSLAAYEPTGPFRQTVSGLTPGDQVAAGGGVRPHPNGGLTLNLEFLTVKYLRKSEDGNPVCRACHLHMESMGSGKGHRCRRCGLRSWNYTKVRYPLRRNLEEGRKYQPPPRAHRHLTKPLSRMFGGSKPEPPRISSAWSSFTRG